MAKAANLAYDTIREAILNGDFKPGERLPEQAPFVCVVALEHPSEKPLDASPQTITLSLAPIRAPR